MAASWCTTSSLSTSKVGEEVEYNKGLAIFLSLDGGSLTSEVCQWGKAAVAACD